MFNHLEALREALSPEKKQLKTKWAREVRGDVGPRDWHKAGYRGPGLYVVIAANNPKMKGPFEDEQEAENFKLWNDEYRFGVVKYLDHRDPNWYSTLTTTVTRDQELNRRRGYNAGTGVAMQ